MVVGFPHSIINVLLSIHQWCIHVLYRTRFKSLDKGFYLLENFYSRAKNPDASLNLPLYKCPFFGLPLRPRFKTCMLVINESYVPHLSRQLIEYFSALFTYNNDQNPFRLPLDIESDPHHTISNIDSISDY